jgi:hypothetical protein
MPSQSLTSTPTKAASSVRPQKIAKYLNHVKIGGTGGRPGSPAFACGEVLAGAEFGAPLAAPTAECRLLCEMRHSLFTEGRESSCYWIIGSICQLDLVFVGTFSASG